MKESFVEHLACPFCEGDLIVAQVHAKRDERIAEGELACTKCKRTFPVHRFIPRFVPNDNYASNFGLEWSKHARTQYDSYTGLNISEKRFFEETKWGRDLKQEVILEVGSGSGRFTEQAASTGAFVVSMDYSFAVDANYQSNGAKDNVFIVQGDMFNMPFKKQHFDKLLCIGVIQHTPDPLKAFLALPAYLKKNGKLVVDVYKRGLDDTLGVKYLLRVVTKKMKPEKLYRFVVAYVDFMWPMATAIRKIPKIGPSINWALGVADYSRLGLKGELLKEWAYLDTYDMFSPRYDYPQSLSTVKKWFEEAGLKKIEVHYGYNGIEGRGTTP